MTVTSIKLKNFRGFQDVTIPLHEKLTVLVGPNGAGKTALLDAISIALGAFLTGFDGPKSPEISPSDATLTTRNTGALPEAVPRFPVCISAEGTCNGQTVSWERELLHVSGKTTTSKAKDLVAIGKAYQQKLRAEDSDELTPPLLSSYGAGRLWAQKSGKQKWNSFGKYIRATGYTNCLAERRMKC